MPAPDSHVLEVEATIPTDGMDAVQLLMATWTPGFYKVENYATRVLSISARAPGGGDVPLGHPQPNRWHAETRGLGSLVVSYRLKCAEQTVTTNWVGDGYAVLNGPATFITLAGAARRAHEVSVELPKGWSEVRTALPAAPGGGRWKYLAPDFDTLADSPLVAGNPVVRTFDVGGVPHALVAIGAVKGFDLKRAAADLKKIVMAQSQIWGGLPFKRYEFLLVLRSGRGGLEHGDSMLATTQVDELRTEAGYARWLDFISHEYCHAFNAKRLRPIELGPFNYEQEPRTPSLWITEGFTTYFGEMALVHAGLMKPEQFLASLSKEIASLQGTPGRLAQTLEASSNDVWTSESISGIGGDPKTSVSYYTKGYIVAFLLDAKVRRSTGGSRTLQDVMRLAYGRYGGARGFKPEEFRSAASEVAGSDLEPWFHRAIASVGELDYDEALSWYGLGFAPGSFTLERRPGADSEKQRHLEALFRP
jgi:predicted metalloprotease with PDZ domain